MNFSKEFNSYSVIPVLDISNNNRFFFSILFATVYHIGTLFGLSLITYYIFSPVMVNNETTGVKNYCEMISLVFGTP